MSSGATAEGLCTNWEGSGTGKNGASAPVGAWFADVIADVVAGANALVFISTIVNISTLAPVATSAVFWRLGRRRTHWGG